MTHHRDMEYKDTLFTTNFPKKFATWYTHLNETSYWRFIFFDYLRSMNQNITISVFCSAAEGLPTLYCSEASRLGEWIGQQGWQLVYGGASLGLMEHVAEGAKREGATITGVVPSKLKERGIISKLIDQVIPVDSLSKRKAVMLERSDLSVALPGGLGTLDEIFHVLGEASIGYHNKPVILYNSNGCYNVLLQLFDDLRQQGLLRHSLAGRLIVVNDFNTLTTAIKSVVANKAQGELF